MFEAIINSIHGLEEAQIPPEKGLIRVAIEQEPAPLYDTPNDDTISSHSEGGDIVNFRVIDNGVGFNEANFNSFKTLDTDYKVKKGGRGIGRLLWLKAFARVDVKSYFLNDSGTLKQRTFSFSPDGISGNTVITATDKAQRETTVHLIDFGKNYRNRTLKKVDAIARAMVEHCLWYFVRPGGAPKIIVQDKGEEILLDDLFQGLMHSSVVPDHIKVKDSHFDLLHVQLRTSTSTTNSIGYCADDRLVMEEKISKHIPSLHGRLSDGEREFVYMCYVSSDLLNAHVRPERNTFEILPDSAELFEDTEISWSDISNGVVSSISEYLREHLDEIKKRVQERIHEFVSTKAPRYRPILTYLKLNELNIDPEISDKDLGPILYRKYAELEEGLFTEGQALMKPQSAEPDNDYEVRIGSYLQKVDDIKKSDLVDYVAHRRVIIDLLSTAIERNPDGRYVREDLLHQLIMPMRTDSSEVHQDNCNLWLIDERLAFHDYLASDKTLSSMPITGSSSTMEPDLVALNLFDNPILVADSTTPPLASITVIELKRPMRNDAAEGKDKDPIEQALSYLDEIRRGGVRTAMGRPIPRSQGIPGFCYVICDLTPSIVNRCKVHDYTRTSDGLGYFAYNKHYEAYVEVISFDRLLNAARERHQAFFEKLGLPTS